eukprot:748060-Hanusia_phi.AAC.4
MVLSIHCKTPPSPPPHHSSSTMIRSCTHIRCGPLRGTRDKAYRRTRMHQTLHRQIRKGLRPVVREGERTASSRTRSTSGVPRGL